MWPRIGEFPTYSAFYFGGIILQGLLAWWFCRQLELPRRTAWLISTAYAFGMVVGAKALFDLRAGRFDAALLLDPGHYFSGGLWGGLLAYFLIASVLVLLILEDRRGAFDVVVLTVPLPWIVAKTGCLMAGCCYGGESSGPFAVTFTSPHAMAPTGVARHPTQVYEILVMVAILVVLRRLRGKRWRGTLLFWFLAMYGAGRAAVNLFRGDLDGGIRVGPILLTQWICIGSAVVAAGALVVVAQRTAGRPSPRQRGAPP